MFNNQQPQNDPFSQIAGGRVTERGVWFVPGVYPLLYVDSLQIKQTRKGDLVFIAEFDIIESNTPERPSGTKVTWIVNFRHESAPNNIKTFLCKLMDVTSEEVTADVSKMAVSSDNPCHGYLIRAEATNVQTKTGGDFTVLNWRTAPKEIQEKAEELRKQAGFAF